MELTDKIRNAIQEGRPQETADLVARAVEFGIETDKIVEEGMLPAMHDLGNAFQDPANDIPRILSAARSIRNGFDIIEQQYGADVFGDLGTVILGTVEGDLHDVGKNLVALMFKSVGFQVIDLGVDISGKQFAKAVEEHPEASFVCISSLLSTSVPQMKRVVKSLSRNPKRGYKIMVGGGAVTRQLAEEMGADLYTETAADAAELARRYLVGGNEL